MLEKRLTSRIKGETNQFYIKCGSWKGACLYNSCYHLNVSWISPLENVLLVLASLGLKESNRQARLCLLYSRIRNYRSGMRNNRCLIVTIFLVRFLMWEITKRRLTNSEFLSTWSMVVLYFGSWKGLLLEILSNVGVLYGVSFFSWVVMPGTLWWWLMCWPSLCFYSYLFFLFLAILFFVILSILKFLCTNSFAS